MSLTLDLSEKATVAVAFDPGTGTAAPLGQHGWDASGYTGLVHFVNDPDGVTTWIVADAPGSAVVHFFTVGGSVGASLDVAITVTGTLPPPPGTPSLTVTFGTPEPK